MLRSSLFVAALFFAALSAAQAGTGYSSNQSAQEVEDIGEISESTDGKDTPPPEQSKFRANVSTRAQYTSNAKLSGNHGSSDVIFFPTVEVGYNTPLGRGFTLDLMGRVDSGLYVEENDRSFIGYSVQGTLDWRPRSTAPRLFVSVEPYRYDSFDEGGLITQAIGTSVGTDWGYAFNNGNSLAFVGYNYTYYFSDPTIDNRGTHRALAGLSHMFRPQLMGQLLYQFQYSDYDDVDREDFRHIVALNLTYQFNRNWFATLSGNFVDSDSTQNRASYQSAGGSLGLTWQF